MAQRPNQIRVDGKLLKRFSDVVDGIYHAALSPQYWPSAVERIADLHSCPSALLLTPSTAPRSGGFVFPHGISEANLQLWATKYVDQDPWVKAAVEKNAFREGNVFLGDQLLPRSKLKQTVFYREFLTRVDLGSFCTGIVFDGSRPNYFPTVCSFFHRLNGPRFGSRDVAVHDLTVKHLSRALGTMYRLRDAELRLAANMAALDRIAVGVMLFGERGNVVFANQAARAMTGSKDGLRFRSGDPINDGVGWLVAERPDDHSRLTKAITEAVGMNPFPVSHFANGMLIARASGKRSYMLQVSSLAPDNEFSRGERQAWAIGFLSELDSVPRVDAALLTQTFDLTTAECAVAQAILSGDTLETIAGRLGSSENTVKTQLQSIYDKTGTHRQAQLVKLLMGLASTRA